MPRWLAILTLVVFALGALAWVYRVELSFAAMFLTMEPDHGFADKPQPPSPDYADAANWAALPGRADGADEVPPGIPRIAEDQTPVDVFFIHPTTYYKGERWNQPLDDGDANAITDNFILVNQASTFAGCCRVYAPRYRQATLFSFMPDSGDNGRQALELAYADVVSAFEVFLNEHNKGRPFILAAHSQGSRHLEILLKAISGTPLAERVVAAYPVGWFVDTGALADDAPDFPVCATPTQTQCVVSWNAMAPGTEVPWTDTSSAVCVNPLSWRADGETVPHDANLGGWGRSDLDVPPQSVPLQPGVADARCANGVLEVSDLRSDEFPFEMGPGNYHAYDYGLYWVNIYQNAAERVAAWVEARATVPETGADVPG